MEVSKSESEEKPRDLWKNAYFDDYQLHVTIPSTDPATETDEKVIYIDDLEKREEVYGLCGECNEPGTGMSWCQPCNAKRLRDNFKNWTSGNKDIDEFIQQSQLDALHRSKCLEWIPYEDFQNVTYVTRGGFGKIYSAKWPQGHLEHWDIEKEKWHRNRNQAVALKSLDDSLNISKGFLNEIRSHLQICFGEIIECYGVTQDPITKDYMMVLFYCRSGNLRDYLNKESNLDCKRKIERLLQIARGLLDIHNAGKVHKDFHSGNILFAHSAYISDLGMCQPASNERSKKEGNYGVLPYMAPEVLRGHQYTKAADVYSFGIIMNEFMSEEIPYNDIPHDHILAIEVCKGHRPKISEDTPELLADLIRKCWDAKAENRPIAKDLFQLFNKWDGGDNEIKSQIEECKKIKKNKLNKKLNKNIQTHPQAIYTSRLLRFQNLPEPVNSDLNEDCQLSELDLNDDCQLSESDLNEVEDDGDIE